MDKHPQRAKVGDRRYVRESAVGDAGKSEYKVREEFVKARVLGNGRIE